MTLQKLAVETEYTFLFVIIIILGLLVQLGHGDLEKLPKMEWLTINIGLSNRVP